MHARGAVILENHLGRVRHPEFLRLGDATLTLIDDPLVERIASGDPAMGWEGDERLALYAAPGAWVLVRLESNGTYSSVARTDLAAAGLGAIDVVGQLVGFLVTHDVRRGYDPLADVHTHNAARERRLDAEHDDFVANDLADRLRFAFRRDLGHRL